ncbi:hypothetical protein JEZ13_09145 [bacterium]|nr:hypothetical protein [bacterium]
MKRIIVFLLFVVFTSLIFANNAYDLQFTCTQPILNVLKVSYFDPAAPFSQPIILCLRIDLPDGLTNATADYELEVDFFWNSGRLTGTTLTPVDNIINPNGTFINVTNQHLITASTNNYFEADGSFSFDDIVDSNSQFKDFVLETGKFPDGEYRIDITLIPRSSGYIGDNGSITFQVRGIQSVRVISPGVIAGAANIPIIFKPIIFNWNTSGRDNNFVIEIKEFDQVYELDPSNIEFNGRLVEQEEVTNNTIYTPYYTFQESKYYAWRAKVKFIGEETLNLNDHEQYISSNYHVFQFGCAPNVNVPNAFQEELLNNLQNLNIAEINSLLDAGYFPKDGITLNGKTYYGKEAVDKLRELFMTYTIEVSIE